MVKATNRESALNWAGWALNCAAESAAGCNCGRPVKPRGALYSVPPEVARTTTSPSPTTGLSVYAAQRPSLDSDAPLMVRHASYVSCVMGFLPAGSGGGAQRDTLVKTLAEPAVFCAERGWALAEARMAV